MQAPILPTGVDRSVSPSALIGMSLPTLGVDACGLGSARPSACGPNVSGAQWLVLPPRVYFKFGCLTTALQSELRTRHRVMIVSSDVAFDLGFAQKVLAILRGIGALTDVFHDVSVTTFETVAKGADRMRLFKPDALVAIGGGSVLDASKIMWLFYNHPEWQTKVDVLCAPSSEVRTKAFTLPRADTRKCQLVLVPTTSGTGSEVSPFAFIKDSKTGVKRTFLDYGLMSDIAICDPEIILGLPKKSVASGGMNALCSALEAYASPISTGFTAGYCLEALTLVFGFLGRSYARAEDQAAREAVHYAATLAGIAAGNSFHGLCHSCALALEDLFGIPSGVANALMLPYVIRYNSEGEPASAARSLYARTAYQLRLCDASVKDEKAQVSALIKGIEDLKRTVGIAGSLKEYGVPEAAFREKVALLAQLAVEDQAAITNPRAPHAEEVRQLFLDAYEGTLAKSS